MKTKQNAIVVGAGFGGLAAALRLCKKGYEVTVLEAGDQAGGRARVFNRDGFTFDAGPTVITAPYLIDELFGLFNKDPKNYYELLPVDPFYKVLFHDGETFDYVGDEDRLLKQIARISPEDVEGYKKLAKHSERIFDIGYMKLADAPFDNFTEMLRVIPDMIRLQNYTSVYGLVSKYIKSEKLRQVFSFQPLLVGGNPFRTTSIYMLIHWLERKWGVFFAKGGTGALVKALLKLMEEEGIQVRYNAPVKEIIFSGNKCAGAQIESGEVINSDIVACNADPSFVYSRMMGAKEKTKHTASKIQSRRPSMSLFVSYFGVRKKFNNLAHHTIILGPRYKDLLHDIFETKVLADDFSLYLHAPTVTDITLAPEGCECFYVLSPVPNNRSKIDWKIQGPRYQEKILKFLDQHHLPGLLENLATSFYVTPDYFEGDLRSIDGAAFGLEPRFTQSAYFRYHNRSEEADGLYFVGASTHPGAGVPGVLCSAKVLDKIIPDVRY